MPMYNQQVLHELNGLIRLCERGLRAYAAASVAVRDSALQALFRGYAQRWLQFGTDLRNEVRLRGGQFTPEGVPYAMPMAEWGNLKAALLNNDDHAILMACGQSDADALQHYAQVEQMDLPPDVLTRVRRQAHQIREAHQCLMALQCYMIEVGIEKTV